MSESLRDLIRDARGREIRPGAKVAAPRVGGVSLERVSAVSEDGVVFFVSGRSSPAERVAVYAPR